MYPDKLKILYLEDVEADVEHIARILQKSNIAFDLHVVTAKEDYIAALHYLLPDLILSDHNLPDINSQEALDILKKTGIRIPFILVTGTVSEEFAAEIILMGADDYILKDRPERLPIAIKNVLEKFRLGDTQRNAEEKLAASEKRYRAMIEKSADLITLTLADGTILYASPSVEKLLGYTPEEFASRPGIEYTHPDDVARIISQRVVLLETPGGSHFREQRLLLKNGTYGWFECTVTNLLHDPAVGALVANFRDITDRKIAEEKIINTQRLYEFISQINQAIVQTPDEKKLFRKACDIAVDISNFGLSWIGIPDLASKKINVVAYNNNAGSTDIAALADLEFDDDGPTANVLRNGKYFVVNDFGDRPSASSSKIFASERGYKSLIVLPIKKSGNTIATYCMLSTQANLFDEQEIRLLETVAGDISFALDVFEKERHRKEMEERMIHDELRLKQAQAIGHIGSWEVDFSTGIGKWSAEACRIFGLAPENNLHSYQSWISFTHPADLDRVLKLIREGERTLTGWSFDHRIILKNGEIKHILSEGHFEFDDKDKVIGIYGISHDITKTKEAEIALIQSEANLIQIIDLIPQSIFTKDDDGKYIFVNKTYAAFYGYTPEQLNKKFMSDVIPGKHLAEYYLQEDRQVISSGISKIIPEVTVNDHNGDTRVLHILKVPFTIASTSKKSVLVIMNDITEQKKAESERVKMVADIVRRNNDLEQFSQIISHNLRGPVASVLGIVSLMQTTDLDEEEEKEVRNYLSAAVNSLDSVIKDLNHILQVKHTEDKINEYVKFSDLVRDIKVSIGHLIRSEDVSILFDFSAVEEMQTIKSYLYSIFFNLISNSIKYRRPAIPPVIDITSERHSGKIAIVFKDNGLGINVEKIGDKLFGLYKRFHHHVEGKGMGLFMVKTQVELLGGKITVSGDTNSGTEFRIEFENRQKDIVRSLLYYRFAE